jgi:hypothetical protein
MMIEWWWGIVIVVGVVVSTIAICKFAYWVAGCADDSKELKRLREKDKRDHEKSLFRASIMDDVFAYYGGLSKRQDQIFDRVRKIETEVREMQNKMEKEDG